MISGNNIGIDDVGGLNGGNSIEGDLIGTNASGLAALGNTSIGINVTSFGNTIGGLTATPGTGAGNVISGNPIGIDDVGAG